MEAPGSEGAQQRVKDAVLPSGDEMDSSNLTLPSPSSAKPLLQDSTAKVVALPGIGLSYPVEDYTAPSTKSSHDLKTSFSWAELLNNTGFVAAPVHTFRHAPMSDCWENIIVGMKVEVENRDNPEHTAAANGGKGGSDGGGVFSNAYWVASVLRISGYSALLRYEGFGQDSSKDFWMNLCSDKVHPVGWCATKGKSLIPPKTIQTKQNDWKDFLVKRLTGARTLPSNFYLKVWESVDSIFRPGMKLEVVDKMRICQVRVATIEEIVGRRLYLTYDEVDHDDRGFWCHEESPLIHPVGWARRVGHQIVASQEYFDRCAMDNLRPTDCTPDMFPEYKVPQGGSSVAFGVGMKIEAVDPLNLATICVATVMKVLRFGYIMVRIDGYENDATGSDWFCYHQSSPLIFPPGFCERNNLALKPPVSTPGGEEEKFSWYEYLKNTRSQAAPVNLFINREEIKHGFKVGMKIEATDQMDPRLVCVSTISRVVGRMLKVHFDGWEDEYDQWMDCEGVDIYPVGWAELVGHKLEGPRRPTTLPAKKEKRKPAGGGGRKSKKRTGGGSTPTPPATSAVGNSHSSTGNGASSNSNGATAATAVSNGSHKKQSKNVSKANSSSPNTTDRIKNSRSPTPDQDLEPPPLKIQLPSPGAASATSSDPPAQKQYEPTLPSTTSSESSTVKVIPRLVDSAGQAAPPGGGGVGGADLDPTNWSVEEVSTFLEINECSTLAGAFSEQKIDGNRFLALVKEDIMKLVNNKIGPCLKIENLQRLLKARMSPAQARFQATMTRKSS